MLEQREKLLDDLHARGFYFTDDQIFDAFLKETEEWSKQNNTPEINYYHAFEQKFKEIENNRGFPAIGGITIHLAYKKKGSKQYEISEIITPYNEELKKHKNSRFS